MSLAPTQAMSLAPTQGNKKPLLQRAEESQKNHQEHKVFKHDATIGLGQAFGFLALTAGSTGAILGCAAGLATAGPGGAGIGLIVGGVGTATGVALTGKVAQYALEAGIDASLFVMNGAWSATTFTISLPFKAVSVAYTAMSNALSAPTITVPDEDY